MSDEKKITSDLAEELDKAAEEAKKQEEVAKQAEDAGRYTHELKEAFAWEGKTYEKLEFRWDTLTGKDHLDIENELLMRGKTLVVPEYTGDYLLGMAVRACTERNEKGGRVLTVAALKNLPLGDFMQITKRARTFLLRAGR